MSRKLKFERKRRKQKVVPKTPQQASRPPVPVAAKPQTQLWIRLGLLLTVVGLIALIELFPRLSASATPPLDLGNQLASSRFTVRNEGYLQVTDVMSACFLWKVAEGGFSATSSMARVVMPPENKLRPAGGLTVPCTSENMIGTNPPYMLNLRYADLAIVVYYRVWPFTFYRTHRLFRFVARIGKNGEVVWDKQPSTEALEQDYDNFIRSGGGTFPPQLSPSR
jgi:hypothetical protein